MRIHTSSSSRAMVVSFRVRPLAPFMYLRFVVVFEQDTFATDSLRHILALLSSLDSQSFSLVASISLTNRSRIKDFWVFTGPAPDNTPADPLETPMLESSALRRFSFPPGNVDPQHKKLTTEQSLAVPHPPLHNRSSSEETKRSPNGQSNVLRKGAPRAQVPVDIRASEYVEQGPSNRPHLLPSIVPEGAENMTGVGSALTPNVFYETSPFGTSSGDRGLPSPGPIPLSPTPRRPSPVVRSQVRPVSGGVKTPPLLASSSPPPRQKSPASFRNSKPTTPVAELHPGVPLLPSGVFRDSSMTSDTDITREIPIKWTGPLNKDLVTAKDETSKPRPHEPSGSPVIPGSWRRTPSPIADKAGDFKRNSTERQRKSQTPIHETESRVEAPEVVQPDAELRKSEAALVGMIRATETPPPPVPTAHRKDTSASTGNGQGWVMVNVENPQSSAPQLGSETKGVSRHTPGASGSQTSVSTGEGDQLRPQQASPEAKAIVVIDVLNSKNKKARSATNTKESDSGMRRLFSLTRKNSSVSFPLVSGNDTLTSIRNRRLMEKKIRINALRPL